MSLLYLANVIALRRIISNWRLELVLFLGILLAVALLSSSVVFSDMLAETALRHALDEATAEKANTTLRVYNLLDDPATVPRGASLYQSSLDFVEQRAEAPLQPYLQDRSHLLETATFFFKGHPQLELDDELRPRGKINYMSGLFPTRVQVTKGRWPYTSSVSPPSPGQPLEVAIDSLGAELLQLGVGDEMEVFPATGAKARPSMRAKIVALFRRVDPDDEFWYGSSDAFSFKDERWTMVPLFTTEDAILERVGQAYPGLFTDVTWFFYLDRHGIRAGDVRALTDTIRRVEHDVRSNLDHSSTVIKLDDVLDDYEEQILLARIPLFLMVFLVTGVLTYYLVLVAGLMVRSRATEISMLKSRGSTTLQIGLLALVEGLLLAVPAVALGPLLALGVSQALGRVFFEFQARTGDLAPIALSSQAFLLGLGGALVAVAVLTISTLVAARHGIVEYRQTGARPSRALFIHRYYLDVLALALVALIWWQFQSRGSFLVRSLGTGELEIDYSLLLGPVLLLLAAGLLVLRAFPWAVALLAKVSEPMAPAWLVQGLRRVSRDPIMPGTLVVLVMMAMALGVIGSAFSSTLERSQRDRALYAAGADLRIEHGGGRDPIPLLELPDLAEELDEAERVAEVERTRSSLFTSVFDTTTVSLLAVDTDNFTHVAWYRPDFAGERPLEELIRAISPSSPALSSPRPSVDTLPMGEETGGAADGIRLPQDATTLALWVHPDRPDRPDFGSHLKARLQDARGQYFDVPMGDLNFRGWRRLRAERPLKLSGAVLPPPGRRSRDRPQPLDVTPPFTLLSLLVSTRSSITEPGALFLGELTAITPGGENVIADFQTLDGWHVVEDYSRPGLYALELSESVSQPGVAKSARFSWSPGGTGIRGIRAGGPLRPMPAVVSKSLLDMAEARVGDTLIIGTSSVTLPIQAVSVADYFPTLDPMEGPFLVVGLRTFTHYASLHSQRPASGSNELWVSTDAPAQLSEALIGSLDSRGIRVREAHIASEMVSQRVERPLVNAGWGGLLVLMFLALVLASTSGIMLFSYMDTRERQTEFALLRTMGFSRGQINGVVSFSLLLVVACGIGLGTVVGQIIATGFSAAGHQIVTGLLPVLEVAEEGIRVTPPMVLQSNWMILLGSYLVLVAVTASTVVWLAWLTARLEVQQVLRAGEA